MRELGILVQIDDREGIVELDSRGGCRRCGMNEFCQSTGSGKRRFKVHLGGEHYQTGDLVEIETPAKSLITAAFLIFILPLLLSFAAYSIVFSITENLDLSIIGFILCFVIAEIGIAWIDRIFGKRRSLKTRIVRKLKK